MTDQAREAAKEIYEAQTDTGRTFDNSYTEQEIYAVIQRACDKSYSAGLSAGREQAAITMVLEGEHAYAAQIRALGATQPEVK